jgi:hypothetical protein
MTFSSYKSSGYPFMVTGDLCTTEQASVRGNTKPIGGDMGSITCLSKNSQISPRHAGGGTIVDSDYLAPTGGCCVIK